MADEKELAALDEARAEMIKAIAEYRPVALKELSRIARVHIEQCWGDRDLVHEIWEEAFVESEPLVKKAEDEAP